MSWLKRQPKPRQRDLVGTAYWPGYTSTEPCLEAGCEGVDRVYCDYRDRRGTACPTSWCRKHEVVVAGQHLCRRHARLVQALRPMELRCEIAPPDVANRSPALAAYVAENLDTRIRGLLEEFRRPDHGEKIDIEPLMLVTLPPAIRRWNLSWTLYDSNGMTLRIGVDVEEDMDPELTLRVNSRAIARCVPPWISRRKAGHPLIGEADDADREAFYDGLVKLYFRPAAEAEARWMRRWEPSLNAAHATHSF